jgi:hypothetical protein
MKKHLLIAFSLLMVSFASWSQTEVFNNAGAGNNFYSNTENWNNNVLPADNGIAQFNATATLDVSATLSQIRSAALTAGFTDGGGTITLTGDGVVVPILQNAPEAGGEFTIDSKVIFQTTDPAAEPVGRSLFRIDGDQGIITFGPNSDLTLNSPVRLLAVAGKEGQVNMNGILRGSEAFQVGARVKVVFGPTSDNTNLSNSIVLVGPDLIVEANTADNKVFIPTGQKVQVNQPGGKLTLNGANIYQGNLTVGAGNDFRLEVNKDQPNIELLLIGDGVLTMALGSGVDTVAFSEISAAEQAWGTGSLTIENFENAAVRFGTSATGLSAAQLAKINIGGATPSLNSNGYLIDQALNTAPQSKTIQNLTLAEGFSQRVIDLSPFFTDPQKDALTFGASSSESFVTVSVEGSSLTITESALGTSTITLTCTDEFDASTNVTFDVKIDETVVDSDGDGVPDDNDSCSDTPNGETVDETGCSDSQKDSDNDGVTDDVDQCPGTASGATVDNNGCADSQKDTDNDGVSDNLDLCPETPSGATVDADGCADEEKDSDGDGVTDDLDECPDTAADAEVNSRGCLIVLSTKINEAEAYIYPNPAVDYLMIKNIDKWEGGVLIIHDMTGRLVLTQKIQNGQDKISIRQLEVGKYILLLQKGSEKEMLSFLRSN